MSKSQNSLYVTQQQLQTILPITQIEGLNAKLLEYNGMLLGPRIIQLLMAAKSELPPPQVLDRSGFREQERDVNANKIRKMQNYNQIILLTVDPQDHNSLLKWFQARTTSNEDPFEFSYQVGKEHQIKNALKKENKRDINDQIADKNECKSKDENEHHEEHGAVYSSIKIVMVCERPPTLTRQTQISYTPFDYIKDTFPFTNNQSGWNGECILSAHTSETRELRTWPMEMDIDLTVPGYIPRSRNLKNNALKNYAKDFYNQIFTIDYVCSWSGYTNIEETAIGVEEQIILEDQIRQMLECQWNDFVEDIGMPDLQEVSDFLVKMEDQRENKIKDCMTKAKELGSIQNSSAKLRSLGLPLPTHFDRSIGYHKKINQQNLAELAMMNKIIAEMFHSKVNQKNKCGVCRTNKIQYAYTRCGHTICFLCRNKLHTNQNLDEVDENDIDNSENESVYDGTGGEEIICPFCQSVNQDIIKLYGVE